MGFGASSATIDTSGEMETIRSQLREHDTTGEPFFDEHVNCPRCKQFKRGASNPTRRMQAMIGDGGSELGRPREGDGLRPVPMFRPTDERQMYRYEERRRKRAVSEGWKDKSKPYDPRTEIKEEEGDEDMDSAEAALISASRHRKRHSEHPHHAPGGVSTTLPDKIPGVRLPDKVVKRVDDIETTPDDCREISVVETVDGVQVKKTGRLCGNELKFSL